MTRIPLTKIDAVTSVTSVTSMRVCVCISWAYAAQCSLASFKPMLVTGDTGDRKAGRLFGYSIRVVVFPVRAKATPGMTYEPTARGRQSPQPRTMPQEEGMRSMPSHR